ncbi:DUF3619 family protein [Ideonella azotifigens]|uniref:DUF3619 family protein n=1 Tax=Ideonella azotifigens TaxID=513160 RepID=A0ABP3VFE5_9BURK|nr:DUF3619 family protein [Ideonella azotifigens]MCD2344648.1 DUF3619 family protein [Ideonella azotifigens]
MKTPSSRPAEQHRESAGIEARFGLRVTAALSERAQGTPAHDIDTRLRFAREQALARAMASRKLQTQAQTQAASTTVLVGKSARGGAGLLGGHSPWLFRFASALPLVLLLAGVVQIDSWHDRAQVVATADLDTALLSDDLPPDAYSDPGFAEFVKTNRHN